MTATYPLYGRTEILTDAEYVDENNVVDVLTRTKNAHETNSSQIQYLYDYYVGKQAVENRQKVYNTEICNKVTENRANEIVSFKTGYLVGEPIQYINNSENNELSESIKMLNGFMSAEDKAAKDRELAEWVYIAGVGYRAVLPDKQNEEDESPFEVYTLDPRSTYVVKNSGFEHRPVMAVTITKPVEGDTIYSVYTDKYLYKVQKDKVIFRERHFLGDIPIVQYRFNNAMLGAFEIVLSLLDAINEVASNRIDAIENFVQAIMVFKGVDIDDEHFQRLKELGGLKIDENGDVKYLVQEMNQAQTQTLIDYMYETVLTICGMPSTNKTNKSDSSNNGAVMLRNGWTLAEARAKDDENMFKRSEKQFLKIALRICNKYRKQFNLKIFEVEPHFTRRNYENALEKSQILTMMLSNDKIHPRLAFEACGLFIDPESAWLMSEEYYKQREQEQIKEMEEADKTDVEEIDVEGVA